MNYLLWADADGLKDHLKEVESALAILKQVGFPQDGVVANLLLKEQTRLKEEIASQEAYL
jgi:hypothetical protein